MVSVRVAEIDDLPAVQKVDDELKQSRATLEAIISALRDERVFVAEEDGRIVGYLWWSWFWDKWPMATIVRVHPEYQRLGIGRALYQTAEENMRAIGCLFWLSSTEEDNDRSRLFHAALGFREIGALAELDQGVLEVFMRKDLAQ